MQIKRVGITGALCVLGSTIDPNIGAEVSALAASVRNSDIEGVVELVPAFTSLMVRYDPLVTEFDVIAEQLERLACNIKGEVSNVGKIVEIPVCYGGGYGPDLAFVAEHAGLAQADVVRLHSERLYRIYMLGFLPGFPYLGGLDPRLFTPRLQTPRTAIPAGSVGIGGQQTGIYPMTSPGGWQLIGRTPIRLFDPEKPLPYRAGDMIRFIPITAEAMEGEYGD